MKALGEAAIDLPWACPSAASLAGFAPNRSDLFDSIRHDPGAVLLLLRDASAEDSFELSAERYRRGLAFSLRHLRDGVVDWNLPRPKLLLDRCRRQAWLAAQLAERVGGIDKSQAWAGGLLAPLGWIAAALRDPHELELDLLRCDDAADASHWQRERWGVDHASIARRLARSWRLPSWLTTIVGHLGLPVGIAESLGADAPLFRTVQAACRLAQREGFGLGLAVGESLDDVIASLGIDAEEASRIARSASVRSIEAPAWESPDANSCLAELLKWKLDQLDDDRAMLVARLHDDIDGMHVALERQTTDEQERLHTMKLAALAELAAGAGHEINNPLAVISGQAQYVLKQLESVEEQLMEDPDASDAYAPFQRRMAQALQKIVGQAHRIHHVLTDLMQFARPGLPRLQRISLAKLLSEVTLANNSLAMERKVRIAPLEVAGSLHVQADPNQLRTALTNLLKNAIEAAPQDGLAAIRVRTLENGAVEIAIEDNGVGLNDEAKRHMFDPFYCGRPAGRGRGLGLPAAWRLIRQHGGDVRLDETAIGVTRFVVTLPSYEVLEPIDTTPPRPRHPELV
ncbi:MAG: ATP-binding protein [Gemmataceae bacterium]